MTVEDVERALTRLAERSAKVRLRGPHVDMTDAEVWPSLDEHNLRLDVTRPHGYTLTLPREGFEGAEWSEDGGTLEIRADGDTIEIEVLKVGP